MTDDAGVPVLCTLHRVRVTVPDREMVGFGLPTMVSENC